jgi:hypothetical protein
MPTMMNNTVVTISKDIQLGGGYLVKFQPQDNH